MADMRLVIAVAGLALFRLGRCQQNDVVTFSSRTYLEDHPAHDLIQGAPHRTGANLTFDAVQFKGPVNSGQLLALFTTRFFRDERTGQAWPFGPTLRALRGGHFDVKLTNNLLAGPAEMTKSKTTSNIYKAPDIVSLHAHGLHAGTGVPSQPLKGQEPPYIGEDNFFTALKPKLTPSAKPESITYHYSLPLDHLPGTHWYHPHHMGSSMLQQTSASGVLIVEDDPAWFQGDNCTGMLFALGERGLVDRVLHMEGFFFANASVENLDMSATDGSGFMEDSYPSVAWKSNTRDPLCCNTTRTRQPFAALGEDFTLINGIYQPTIRLTAGVWQRWRFVNAIPARYLDMTLVQGDGTPSGCELALFAKDGLYMLSIPRNVPHIMLPGAGRAELLVRCPARSPKGVAYQDGTHLVLRSGSGPTKPSEDCTTYTCYPLKQDLATLELSVPSTPSKEKSVLEKDLAYGACQPLRPAYAADLRKAQLATLKLPKAPSIIPFQLNFTPTLTRPIESYMPEDDEPVTSLGPLSLQLPPAVAPAGATAGAASMAPSAAGSVGQMTSPFVTAVGTATNTVVPTPPVAGHGAPMVATMPPVAGHGAPMVATMPPATRPAVAPVAPATSKPAVAPAASKPAVAPVAPAVSKPAVAPVAPAASKPAVAPLAPDTSRPAVAPAAKPSLIPGDSAVSAASLPNQGLAGRRLQEMVEEEQRRRLLQRKGGVLGGPEREMYGCSVNHETERFPDPNPIPIPLGTVQEWSLLNVHIHSFHLHVNPYQVTDFADGTGPTNWFQAGDYHDTLLLPMGGGVATIRFQPGGFAGYSLVHCHVLLHVDQGCSKVVQWQCPGVEGNSPQPNICSNVTVLVPGFNPGANKYLTS